MRPATRLLAKFLEPGAPTGLAGLLTHPAPRSTLIYLYGSTLRKLESIPEYSPYRQATEALTKKRLAAVEATKPEGFDAWYDKVRFQIQKHQEEHGLDPNAFSHGGREFVTARMFKQEIDEREKSASWDGEDEGTPALEGPRTLEERQKELDRLRRENAASDLSLPEIDPEPMLTREQIHELEQKIGAGLIEEVIQVAEGENKLVDIMIENKVWEDCSERPPEGQWSYFERITHTKT